MTLHDPSKIYVSLPGQVSGQSVTASDLGVPALLELGSAHVKPVGSDAAAWNQAAASIPTDYAALAPGSATSCDLSSAILASEGDSTFP